MSKLKRFNTKGILLTYVIVVGLLLALFSIRQTDLAPEYRKIPPELRSFVVSPPRPLPQFVMHSDVGQVLTNNTLEGNWTFAYFTHSACLAECRTVFDVLKNTRSALADNKLQFLLIGLDYLHESADQLAAFIATQGASFTTAVGNKETMESLLQSFQLLFLKTDYKDGSYLIEQTHTIFLIDPKGRVYARFEPPYNSIDIAQLYFKLRTFYARSE